MTRLSALAISEVVQAFALAGLGDAARDFDALTEVLLVMRNRIRASPVSEELQAQRLAIQRCVSPLVNWLEMEGDVSALGIPQKVVLLWSLYTATVSRTTLAEQFGLICGNEETWHDTMAELFLTGPIAGADPVSPSRRFGAMHLWLFGLGCFGFALDQVVSSGRWRFYLVIFSTCCLGLAGVWWQMTRTSSTTRHAPVGARERLARTPVTGANQAGQAHLVIAPDLPPPAAPPLPGCSASAPVPGGSLLASGTRVMLNGTGTAAALQGQCGSISGCVGGQYEVDLDSGIKISRVSQDGLTVIPVGAQLPSSTPLTLNPLQTANNNLVYAPFANQALQSDPVKLQAGRLKDSLEKAYALQSTQPAWGALFWQAVKNEAELFGLQDRVRGVLLGHGYVGDSTVGPPRYEELKKQMTELEIFGAVPHGTPGSLLQSAGDGMASDPERMVWHLRLPPDLQRAGPEIYRNIRSEGVA